MIMQEEFIMIKVKLLSTCDFYIYNSLDRIEVEVVPESNDIVAKENLYCPRYYRK